MSEANDFQPLPSKVEQVAKINPSFPDRPTAEEIEREYTPDRVLRLCRYVASRVTRGKASKDDFDEAVQNAALSFYRRVQMYNNQSVHLQDAYPFYYWLLFRMMTDVREIRYREGRRLAGRKIYSLSARPRGDMVDDPVPGVLDRMTVEDALMCLTDRQAEAVRLVYFEHHTQKECARIMGIAQPNVNKLLKRSVEKMRELLEPEDEV